MKLRWSHTVLNIKDVKKILDFYVGTLGFQISDRGPLAENGPEIIFMSQDPNEHHQIGLVVSREDEGPSNSLNHLSFRVDSFKDVKTMKSKLESANVDILPLCHGNALSLYFNDPEDNGIEVFWDTPWHVSQPQAVVWDTNLNEEEALAWVEETFKDKPNFTKREGNKRNFVNRNS